MKDQHVQSSQESSQVKSSPKGEGGVEGCEGADGVEQRAASAAHEAEGDDGDEAREGVENISRHGCSHAAAMAAACRGGQGLDRRHQEEEVEEKVKCREVPEAATRW